MYREDVVESPYAMMILRGLQPKPLYEGLTSDPMPGRRLTHAKLEKRRVAAKRAKAARKQQR